MVERLFIAGMNVTLYPHQMAHIAVIDAEKGQIWAVERYVESVVKSLPVYLAELHHWYPFDALWIGYSPALGPLVETLQMADLPVVAFQETKQNIAQAHEALDLALSEGHLKWNVFFVREPEREYALALAWWGSQHRGTGISLV